MLGYNEDNDISFQYRYIELYQLPQYRFLPRCWNAEQSSDGNSVCPSVRLSNACIV